MQNVKQSHALWAVFATLALAMPSGAQELELQEAIELYEEKGAWEQSITALGLLLGKDNLDADQRRRARITLAKAHISLGQEGLAVGVYKQIVRENASFDMRAFGDDAPAIFLKNFGQAVIELRNEEMQAREDQLSRTSQRTAFLRSTALPGWGQRYQGYRSRGYIMLGLTGASIAYAVVADRRFRDVRDTYEGAPAGANFETLYRDFQDQSDRADLALGLVAGIWVFNMIDAGLQGPNITRSGLALKPNGRGGLNLTLAF